MTTSRSVQKVQRWVDLISALLRHRFPVSFESLANEVPAYCDPSKQTASIMRMFERDKDELRALGVPIESVPNGDGVRDQYRLRVNNFYLPYLQLVQDGRAPRAPVPPEGYRTLPSLAFTPDELELIVRAGRRAAQLGDPHLAAEATSALRKIAFDMPLPNDGAAEMVHVDVQHRDPAVLESLAAAVRARKWVRFDYHSMERDAHQSREVDPYGLVFVTGNWYLVGRDRHADARRQFRVRRISALVVNETGPQTADFAVPDEFDISAYAQSRQSWEIGDGDAMQVVVEFAGTTGYVAEAERLGASVDGAPSQRSYRVRRPQAFARWLLTLAGDARPLSPSAVVSAWRDLAARTAALYGELS